MRTFVFTLLATLSSTLSAFGQISFTTDNPTNLTGTFAFDPLADGTMMIGQEPVLFPHFHLDFASDGYTTTDSIFAIEQSGTDFLLYGEDISGEFGGLLQTALETIPIVDGSFNRTGTFTSPFDGAQYGYTYSGTTTTNGSGQISGTFSFAPVPEPSTMFLLGIATSFGAVYYCRNRTRKGKLNAKPNVS